MKINKQQLLSLFYGSPATLMIFIAILVYTKQDDCPLFH